MDLRPGALIAGRYRVERMVGAGGMGEVWAGEHVAIGVKIALKRLLPAAAVDHQIVARFKREAYLLGRIRSDHVARVLDFIADTRFGLVLVMEFVEGDPLANMLEQRRLTVEETLELGVDIAEALCDLSRASVVHRDLKPDNIIMEPREGGRRRAVLVDFGVSRMIAGDGDRDEDITGITHADMAVGTIAFMSPEQLLSSRDVTGASDVYALGAILYRAVAGRHVFGFTDDIDYAQKKLSIEADPLDLPRSDRVAQGLKEVVARALRRQPEERFDSAAAMLADLTALRDLGRAMAIDLDGATEIGGPSSDLANTPLSHRALPSNAPTAPRIKVSAVVNVSEAVDPSSATLPSFDGMAVLKPVPLPRIDLPSTSETEGIFDEVTIQNARGALGPLPALPASSPPSTGRSPEIQGVARMPVVTVPSRADAPGPEIQGVARMPVVTVPSRADAPAPGIAPAGIPRRTVIAAVIAALVGGVIVGFSARAAMSDAPDSPAPSSHARAGAAQRR